MEGILDQLRDEGTLMKPPAMQADLMKRPMTSEDIVSLVPEEQPKKRGSYKKKEADYSAFFIFVPSWVKKKMNLKWLPT